MNILISEKHKSILNEVKGVSEPSIEYANLIYNILEPILIAMIAYGDKDKEEIDIDIRDIIKFIKNDPVTFEELPIEEFEIDLEYTPTTKSLVGDKSYAVGGGYYELTEKEESGSYIIEPSFLLPQEILESVDESIHAKFQFQVYTTNLFDESLLDDLLYDLRDTITHELNHLLEGYKKLKNIGTAKTNLVKSLAGFKNVNTPKIIFEVYTEFLNFLYYSEPWEINANVQEAFSKSVRMSFEEFKKTIQWEIATDMENYSAQELFNKLVETAKNRDPDTVNYHIKNLHKFYLKQYRVYDEAFKEAEEIKDKVYKTKDLLGLFKMYEKRINSAGKKLKKNYMRLYSIDND